PEVTIVGDTEQLVTVTNTYTKKQGSLTIKKSLVAPAGAAFANDTFTINYTCDADGFRDKTVTLANNAQEVINGIPHGTVCTISEVAPDFDGHNKNVVIDRPEVTIVGDTEQLVTVTNTYTKKQGSLTIKKSLVAPAGAAFANDTFTINYTCDADGFRDKTVTLANNAQEVINGIPHGTVCTISETAPDYAGYASAVAIDRANVTIVGEADQLVTVTNTYTEKPGTLTLTKKLVAPADAPFVDNEFTINYTCDADGFRNKTVNLKKNEAYTVANVPAGTVCRVTETVPAFPGYTGTVAIDTPEVTIARATDSVVTVTNTYTRDLGSMVISKQVEVEKNAPFADRVFKINYTCGDAQNPVKAGVVTLANGQSETIADIPTGTECVIAEDTADAAETGYAHAVSIDKPRVVIVKDTPVTSVVTNRYTPLEGSFMISKSVAGDGAAKATGKAFTFNYECTDLRGASLGKQTVEVAEGQSVSVNTRAGSCVISEVAAPIEHTQHAVTYTVDGTEQPAGPVTIQLPADGKTVNVGVVNTYTLDRGVINIVKNVNGLTDAAKKQFVFNYTCVDGTAGQVTAAGDGVAVALGTRIPVGVECEISEDVAAAQAEGYTVVTPAPQKAVINAADEVVDVTFVNEYTAKPVDPPAKDPIKPVPGKKGKLPATGSTVLAVSSVALVALALGGGAVAVARRRKEQ
ncbi:DUF5979 domain-containing protein, partial [Gleimia sp. 6138-11-ORH1]|uniref:DUF5979 domain-containing protein n=1 Tax=Gleimia sp. 6138-11-ORH1 TaxID=2973937 RepID=UPI002167B485